MNDEQKSVIVDNIIHNDYVRIIRFLNSIKDTIVPRPVNLGELLDCKIRINIIDIDDDEIVVVHDVDKTPLEIAILNGHLKMIEKMIEIKTPVSKDSILLLVLSDDFSIKDKIKLLDKFLASGVVFSADKNFIKHLSNRCDPEIIKYFINHKIMTKKYLKGPCKTKFENFLIQKYKTIGALNSEVLVKRDSRGRFLKRKNYTIKKPKLPNELVRNIIGYLPEDQFIRRFSRRR